MKYMNSSSHLLIRLVLCFPEEADVLDESGFDVFVVHKLTEDVKLLTQELVGEIHLMKAGRRRRTQVNNGDAQKNPPKKNTPLPFL